jgi:hypothetical protein
MSPTPVMVQVFLNVAVSAALKEVKAVSAGLKEEKRDILKMINPVNRKRFSLFRMIYN